MYVCFSGNVHVSTGTYRVSKKAEAPPGTGDTGGVSPLM